jgi:hypothetical protein
MKFSTRHALIFSLALPFFVNGCTCSHHEPAPDTPPPPAQESEAIPMEEPTDVDAMPEDLPPGDVEDQEVAPPVDSGTAPAPLPPKTH